MPTSKQILKSAPLTAQVGEFDCRRESLVPRRRSSYVETDPARCRDCGHEFTQRLQVGEAPFCPKCGSTDLVKARALGLAERDGKVVKGEE